MAQQQIDNTADGKWSTEKVSVLLKQYEDSGTLPRHNPFFDKKVKWRKANLNYQYTKGEYLELARIQEDILYFAETYAKVQTDYGQRFIKLRDYQKRVLLQFKKFRFSVYLASRQIGKCLTSETLICIDVPGRGKLTLPIFEAYYMIKKKMTIMDKIIRGLYRLNFKLYIWQEELITKTKEKR